MYAATNTHCAKSVLCFCNRLFTPCFQQASTLRNPCSKEWCFTIFLMPLFYNPCLRECKRQDRVNKGFTDDAPRRPECSATGHHQGKQDYSYIWSIITVLALTSGTWCIYSSLKVCSVPQWWMFKEIGQVFSNIWDIRWMTFNPDSSQEPKVATAKSLSRPQKDHGQLSGASHTTQASTGRAQSGANSP